MEGRTNEGFPNGPGSKNGDNASLRSSKSSRPAAIRNPYAARRPSLGGSKTMTKHANSSNSASSSKLASERVQAPTGNDGHHEQQIHQQEPQIQQQQVQSKELEYWERLPSRNVSFSPAEVLTVSECLKESVARLYCQEGRSVRVTGILANRSIGATGIVMELNDPVATTTAAEAETIRHTLGAAVKKRPRLSLSSSRDSKKRPRNKQRPWFVSSSSSNTKVTQPLQNKNKTPQTTLGVIVDPACVLGSVLERATVGSFVTVIGEFISTRDSNIDAREDSERYCVQVRTLTVSSTATNMVLYQKALDTRRQTMYERYFYQKASSQKVLQGCGPPPYDVFHRELDKRDKKTME